MAMAHPTIAATSTLAMVRAAEARGVPTADLLAGAGLTHASIEDPDARLPASTVLSLWTALRERTADPTLQLTAPTALPFGAYHVIDYLVAASSTVGEGIERFARFFRLIADRIALESGGNDEEHWLCLTMADGSPVPPVYVDYVFAALVSRIRMRIRPNLEVRRLLLRQAVPPSTTSYTDLFGPQVLFGAGSDRLCFSPQEWNAPMSTADAALARLLEDHAHILARHDRAATAGFGTEVRKAIATVLPAGGSAADVADALHLSVRTLQRKLVAVGTSFSELSDEVRSDLALEYLNDPAVSIAEVAFLLGFSEQSSFNRAFRRWTGETPGRWRRLRS